MKSEEKLMFPICESKVVSPMLSGHFSGSVVVTADLEKNMNSSSSRTKSKEKFSFIKLTISKASYFTAENANNLQLFPFE